MFEKRIKNLTLLKKEEENIKKAAEIIKKAFLNNKKILFCGNGGSASDCEHLACEFISKFQKERNSLPAISLCSNNSIITAISNDYTFDDVFKRQIEGLGHSGDILIAITTSGKSKNIINAIKQAQIQGMQVILFTGENKTNLNCTVEINATSNITCEIQEMHITIGHILCEIIENN